MRSWFSSSAQEREKDLSWEPELEADERGFLCCPLLREKFSPLRARVSSSVAVVTAEETLADVVHDDGVLLALTLPRTLGPLFQERSQPPSPTSASPSSVLACGLVGEDQALRSHYASSRSLSTPSVTSTREDPGALVEEEFPPHNQPLV